MLPSSPVPAPKDNTVTFINAPMVGRIKSCEPLVFLEDNSSANQPIITNLSVPYLCSTSHCVGRSVSGDPLCVSRSVSGDPLCVSRSVSGDPLCVSGSVSGDPLCVSRSVSGDWVYHPVCVR